MGKWLIGLAILGVAIISMTQFWPSTAQAPFHQLAPVPNLMSPSPRETVPSLKPKLEWEPSIGASSYGLQLASDAAFTKLVVDQSVISHNYYDITSPLSWNTIYYWRVNASNANGTSMWSSSKEFWTPSSPEPSGRIVFYDGFPNRIYVMNLDGTGRIELANNLSRHCWNPQPAPDGKKIVFEYAESQDAFGAVVYNTEIYIMNSDGSGTTRLTNYDKYDHSPSWFPDGSRIIFSREIGGTMTTSEYGLFVMGVDGSGQRELNIGPGFISSLRNEKGEANLQMPKVSPDGTKIAFVATTDIYVMDLNGENVRKVRSGSYTPLGLAWGADSQHVLYSYSYREGVYIKNIYEEDEKLLFPGGTYASVSSDGNWVVFIKDRTSIWVGSIDGTFVKEIGMGICPAWMP